MTVAIAASACISVGVWGFSGPALSPIWVSPRLAAAIEEIPDCGEPVVATTGFHEPSFIFLQGTDTRILPPAEAAEFLAGEIPQNAEGCRIAAIESREKDAFLKALEAKRVVPALVGEVEGLNINGGDEVLIGLYRVGKASSEN